MPRPKGKKKKDSKNNELSVDVLTGIPAELAGKDFFVLPKNDKLVYTEIGTFKIPKNCKYMNFNTDGVPYDVLTGINFKKLSDEKQKKSVQIHKFAVLTPDRFPLNRDIAGDAEKQFAVEIRKLKIRPLKVIRTINYKPDKKGMYVTDYVVEY